MFEFETLERICTDGQLRLYLKGEVIQEFDKQGEFFSIIFSGQAKCQWFNETYQSNKWPNKKRSWEIKIICRKNIISEPLMEQDFFGDDEIINDTLTKTRIVAEENCLLVQLSKEKFLNSRIKYVYI